MVDQIPQANTAPQAGTPPQVQPQPQAAPIPGTPVQQPVQQPQQIPGASVQPQAQPNGRPQQSANITKPGSKISMKGILIGCGVLFMFVVGGLALVFYNLINNPTQLASVGLDPNTTKSLLQAFSVIFFGVVTFLGIGLLVINLYRVITVKNKGKLGYVIGAFFGFLLFVIAIALGSRVLTMIKGISMENILDSDKLVMPYIQLKDKPTYIRGDDSLKLIAPAVMYYGLNSNYFNSQILPQLGQVNFTEIALDCGNGQQLSMNLTTAQFEGSCVYFRKGEYILNLKTTYINIPTSERLEASFPAGSVLFESEINITPTKGDLLFNDTKTEMIVGKTPSKVMFDASAVFRDLGLGEYKIIWDFDSDGQADKQNLVSTTFVYNQAKLYNVYVRFPELNNHIYSFPLRVEPSDVPVCEILITKSDGKTYAVRTNFFDKNVNIVNYKFDIIDRNNKDKIVDTITNKNGTFNYLFQNAGNYAIETTFLTEDDKQGQCESDDIQVGVSDFQVNYDLYFKSPNSPQFRKVGTTGIVALIDGSLLLKEIPTVIRVQINQLIPNPTTVSKSVLLDGKAQISSDGNTFEFTLQDSEDHEAKIIIEDRPSGAKTEILIPIAIQRDDLIGKLLIRPDTVGTDPFTVTFDASTTVLNDSSDEIVSFSWDFGDGSEPKINFSESIITHTYRYDTKNENGTFTPIVTIKTKKGREISISPETAIIVKRSLQALDINIDSHPAQIAKAGDRVRFSIDFSGLPKEIRWDFGDGKTMSCKTRQECSSTSNIYITAGTYTIRATVEYENQPTINGTITLKVNP